MAKRRSFKRFYVTHAICIGTKLESFEQRLLRAVFDVRCESFGDFLKKHTCDDDGKGNTLSNLAGILRLPATPFFQYHARWIEQKQEVQHDVTA